MSDLLVALAPLVILIYLMTKKNPVPSYKALPMMAVLLYVLRLTYFNSPAVLVHATVIAGLLTALTPILIVWGAIFLFKAMEHSGAMDTLRAWLNSITVNPIAQMMIIAWAFSFLIEGASGFGTPAAIAAPMLVGLGFRPLQTVIVCLIFNSVPVTFGAVGVPTWFGFGESVHLAAPQIIRIGLESALVNTIAGLIIPVIGLLFVFPWSRIKANLGFIMIAVLSCTLPYLAVAAFNYEFPSIIGGLVGTTVSIIAAHKGIGLEKSDAKTAQLPSHIALLQLIKASFPLWATVLVLLVTRIDQLGLKSLLSAAGPAANFNIGQLGSLAISPALVVTLKGIFGTDTTWQHKFLYIPSIVPFFLIGFLSFWLLRTSRFDIKNAWLEAYHRMRHPVIALLGTLVFAKLFMLGGSQSSTMIIGNALADAAGRHWYYFASLLGALGSFFAGSNTVSNLTFAPIQASIAQKLGLDQIVVLSMQSVGGALGKMVCIHDIVAVCSVLGVTGMEGYIIKRTVIPMLAYALIAALCIPLLLWIF